MRYGLIVAPATLPDLRPAPGTLDSDLVRARLPQEDVAIDVVEIDPTIDVAEQIDGFFEARPDGGEAILFYASTYVALTDGGEVFLCLDPTNPDVGDGLRDIVDALRDKHAGPLLFVLDCRHAPDDEDPFRSATVASAIRSALDPARTGVELLVGAQPSELIFEDAVSPFTRAFLAELDEAHPRRRLLASDLYERIHESERLLGVVPCFSHTRGREPFVLLEGTGRSSLASIAEQSEIIAEMTAAEGATRDAAKEREEDAAEAREEGAVKDALAAPIAPPAAVEVDVRRDSIVDEPSVDVVLEEPAPRHDAMIPPPFEAAPEAPVAPPAPEPAPPATVSAPPPPITKSAPPPAVNGTRSAPPPAVNGASERAATTVLISDRPPAPADPGALPKVMISDRPPPVSPSEPPRALRPSDAPDAKAPPVKTSTPPPAPEELVPASSDVIPASEEAPPREPTYEDHLAQGDALASRDAEGALAEYKKALLLVTPAQKEERADVYVRIGEVKLLQDKRREAISNFEKATQLSPNHPPALEAIARLSAEERDWRSVAATEEKILATIEDSQKRFTRLLEFAERWASVAFDTDRARSALQRAREIKPDDLDVLGKLLRVQEASGAAEEAFALRREIADKTPDDHARAEMYAALGKTCLSERKDEEAALSFFDKALDADPQVLEPLATSATLLAERQEWSELEGLYRRMLARTERIPDRGVRRRVRWELNRRLALLYRDHLEDPEAALRAYEKAIVDRPDDMPTRQAAVALARELGKWDAARAHLQTCARLDPMVVQTYHDLFDVFQKLKRPDQAWAAASVTAQLGHADERERFIYEEGKPDGPPKPTRALGPDAWELLRDSDRDHAVEDVLEAITRAAIEAKISDLKALGRLPSLDPAAMQDPKKSTVSIVRSFAWASHLLGVPMPRVYLREDAQVGLAAVISEEPAVIAGSSVLRGKSLSELAFAAGRHLAYHYGSHRLLLYYPVIDDLAACFLAAVRTVMPSAAVPARMEKAVSAVEGRLEPLLDAKARSALERAVLAFEAGGSRADLNRWVGSVERCSTRAGYLLAGDLRTAGTSLATDGGGVLTVEEKMVDLLWFTVSEAFHELRDALGIAIEP